MDAAIGHIYYEDSLLAREIQKYRKKSFGIIHSVSVPVPILYSVFRYLKVPPVVSKYRNTEFHSIFPALWNCLKSFTGLEKYRIITDDCLSLAFSLVLKIQRKLQIVVLNKINRGILKKGYKRVIQRSSRHIRYTDAQVSPLYPHSVLITIKETWWGS